MKSDLFVCCLLLACGNEPSTIQDGGLIAVEVDRSSFTGRFRAPTGDLEMVDVLPDTESRPLEVTVDVDPEDPMGLMLSGRCGFRAVTQSGDRFALAPRTCPPREVPAAKTQERCTEQVTLTGGSGKLANSGLVLSYEGRVDVTCASGEASQRMLTVAVGLYRVDP